MYNEERDAKRAKVEGRSSFTMHNLSYHMIKNVLTFYNKKLWRVKRGELVGDIFGYFKKDRTRTLYNMLPSVELVFGSHDAYLVIPSRSTTINIVVHFPLGQLTNREAVLLHKRLNTFKKSIKDNGHYVKNLGYTVSYFDPDDNIQYNFVTEFFEKGKLYFPNLEYFKFDGKGNILHGTNALYFSLPDSVERINISYLGELDFKDVHRNDYEENHPRLVEYFNRYPKSDVIQSYINLKRLKKLTLRINFGVNFYMDKLSKGLEELNLTNIFVEKTKLHISTLPELQVLYLKFFNLVGFYHQTVDTETINTTQFPELVELYLGTDILGTFDFKIVGKDFLNKLYIQDVTEQEEYEEPFQLTTFTVNNFGSIKHVKDLTLERSVLSLPDSLTMNKLTCQYTNQSNLLSINSEYLDNLSLTNFKGKLVLTKPVKEKVSLFRCEITPHNVAKDEITQSPFEHVQSLNSNLFGYIRYLHIERSKFFLDNSKKHGMPLILSSSRLESTKFGTFDGHIEVTNGLTGELHIFRSTMYTSKLKQFMNNCFNGITRLRINQIHVIPVLSKRVYEYLGTPPVRVNKVHQPELVISNDKLKYLSVSSLNRNKLRITKSISGIVKFYYNDCIFHLESPFTGNIMTHASKVYTTNSTETMSNMFNYARVLKIEHFNFYSLFKHKSGRYKKRLRRLKISNQTVDQIYILGNYHASKFDNYHASKIGNVVVDLNRIKIPKRTILKLDRCWVIGTKCSNIPYKVFMDKCNLNVECFSSLLQGKRVLIKKWSYRKIFSMFYVTKSGVQINVACTEKWIYPRTTTKAEYTSQYDNFNWSVMHSSDERKYQKVPFANLIDIINLKLNTALEL